MKYLLCLLLLSSTVCEVISKPKNFLSSTDYDYDDDDDDDAGGGVLFLVLLGTCLFFFSICMAWFNEKKQAVNEFRLNKMQELCKAVDCFNVDQQYNGELIHIKGQTVTDCLIVDDKFGISASQGIKLKRTVQQYQYEEHRHEHKRKYSPTYYTYTYKCVWRSEKIQSSAFHDQTYKNKPELYLVESQTLLNEEVKLGNFILTESLKQQAKKFEQFLVEDVQVQAAEKEYGKSFPHIEFSKSTKQGNVLYLRQQQNSDTVGDIRITFEIIKCGNASIVGQQYNNTFVPFIIKDKFKSESGSQINDEDEEDKGCYTDFIGGIEKLGQEAAPPIKEIEWLREKMWSKKKVFQMEQSKSLKITFKMRFAAYILMVISIIFLLYPIIWLFSLIPFLGNFAAGLIFLILLGGSLVISLPIILTIIIIAWIWYHPIYGIANFVGFAITFYLLLSVISGETMFQ